MDVRVTPIDPLLTIHKSAVISIFLHFVHGRYRTGPGIGNGSEWSNGTVHFDRTAPLEKDGLIFLKLFRLNRNDPVSFMPKFPKILVEWIAPLIQGLACIIG